LLRIIDSIPTVEAFASLCQRQIVKKDARQEKYNRIMTKVGRHFRGLHCFATWPYALRMPPPPYTPPQVERYARMHQLPRKVEESIKLYFTFQHQRRIGEHEELLVCTQGCVLLCV
jgi:hypothetical protein